MANEAIGSLQRYGYGRETTYGTAVAVTIWPGLTQDFTDNAEEKLDELRGSGSQELARLEPLTFDFKGSVDIIPQDGRLISNIFNARSTNYAGSPAYVHTLAHNDGSGSNPSLTYERAMLTSAGSFYVWAFRGVKLDKVTLTCDTTDLLHLQTDWTAMSVTASGNSPTSITQSTGAPYTYAGGVMTLGGTVITELRNAEATITQVKSPQHYQTSGTNLFVIGADVETQRNYEGKFTVSQTDNTFYQRFLGRGAANAAGTPISSGGNFNVEFRWRKMSGTGLDANDYISVVMSGCRFVNTPPSGGIDDVQTQELNFKAERCVATVGDSLSGTQFF